MVDAQVILERAKEEKEQERELLRPVAEFFHDHEGELFERYEAVDELVADDSISSSDERMLHRVVGNLSADRVDPVQNVVRDDAKYVGVLEYEEHDYWYEYTEVNDVHGRMNVGVCAQCVKEADSDAEVARGCGTTEELSKRISDHYEEVHSESPESVETGATLVSGTTIAGNTAIHTANDGVGSGLDADQFRGTEGSGLINIGTNYFETTQSAGTILSGFSTPCSGPWGVTFDPSDSIWISDEVSNSVYRTDQSGNVETQFSGNTFVSDMAYDNSNNSLWVSDSTDNLIKEFNQSGTKITEFSSPSDGADAMGVDSTTSLWTSNEFRNSLYKINRSGTVQQQFDTTSPIDGVNGMAVADSSDCLWMVSIKNDSLYKADQSLNVQSQRAVIDGVQSIGIDSASTFWFSNTSDNEIQTLAESDRVKYE